MTVTFLGGAGTVTGSKTLLEAGGKKILVDCGMFQGLKNLRERNWQHLPVAAALIDCVLLTHGHLDHCGWLPCLVRKGFSGPVYGSRPTREITKLILADSAKIQEEEADDANARGYSRHETARPLYTMEEATCVTPHLKAVGMGEILKIGDVEVVFRNAGHIIGACSIEVRAEGKQLFFSGDIGRDDDVLLFPPEKPRCADYIFMESTYGNRHHPKADPKVELDAYITAGVARGGTIVIPGFAVERAQSIMYLLWQLKKDGTLPDVPLYLDSPMAGNMLRLFMENHSWHRLSPDAFSEMAACFHIVEDYRQSLEVIADSRPKIAIAASGMLTGGRVLSYMEHYLSRPETTFVLSGYQAEGTRGRKLLEGAQDIKLHGQYFRVNANVVMLDGLSAHADQDGLLGWLGALEKPPRHIFLNHGENQPADDLRVAIKERYGYSCSVAVINDKLTL